MGERRREFETRIRELEEENRRLRAATFSSAGGATVRVPESFRPPFDSAQQTVAEYFREFHADPTQGTIEIGGERYVLMRAASLSYGFLNAVRKTYADRGDEEALHIGRTLLFDMAHVNGVNDARQFHRTMGVTNPIEKLSAGPVHFAYSGWAFVEILPGSSPTPDDDFFIQYNHPFSFESDSWLRAGKTADLPTCIMSAGYSSGWCEESFGFPLSAAEISCKARGDEHCTFVMAPPHRLREHVSRLMQDASKEERRKVIGSIPLLFERKETEQQLRDARDRAEAASEAKSLFLANMSHEIRTPLTGLLGMSELLLLDDLNEKQRHYVKTIHESGEVLLAILNDILDLSKIEAGMMPISVGVCSVREVLHDVEEVLQPKVDEKDIAFSTTIDEALPRHVSADPLRLRQIVFNLAGNAVKFTEKGTIEIRAQWSEPDELRVEVQDSGIGVDAARIDQLFEIFTQADASDTRRFSGSGLGLSICRRLIQLMGGKIGVKSSKGEGSTFWFTIPAEPVAGATTAAATPEGARPPSKFNAQILVVEDDRVARYVVEKMLVEHGCKVDTAIDGREAVAAAAAGTYDLVLMDCQMPMMDGYEATARIRRLEGTDRRTPVVAMTASVMPGQREKCRAAGMDDFLGKPLDLERLQSVLARWISHA